MDKGTPITITQVGNGFMVEPYRPQREYAHSLQDIRVFNKTEDLEIWMRDHFKVPCQFCGQLVGHNKKCPTLFDAAAMEPIFGTFGQVVHP